MAIKGHVRKRMNIHSGKLVCLECQCLSKNCLNGCTGEEIYSVYHSFRPPKRGSSSWKLIAKTIRAKAFTYPSGSKGSRSFGSHIFQTIRQVPQRMKDRCYLNYIMENSK